MNHEQLLDYYRQPGVFTTVRGFEDQVDAIGEDVASVADAVQRLVLHEGFAPAYGVTLTGEQRAQKELHGAEAILRAVGGEGRQLAAGRRPDERAVGVCRHFATLFVAILRHKRIPARVRAGFAGYFDRTRHTEHWVGEYWNAAEQRWILVDAQVDDAQRGFFKPDIDTLDVPRDRFLVAGDAWKLCRSGSADPQTFGVAGTGNWGSIEVLGEILQDLAALQKIELLPWGWYGLAKDQVNRERETLLFDALGELSARADAGAIDELRRMVAADERIRVPQDAIDAVIKRESTMGVAPAVL